MRIQILIPPICLSPYITAFRFQFIIFGHIIPQIHQVFSILFTILFYERESHLFLCVLTHEVWCGGSLEVFCVEVYLHGWQGKDSL